MIEIPANHKYATLALTISHHLTLGFGEPFSLGHGLWVTGEMPVAVPEHWRQWLGSIRIDRLDEANLFLFTHRPTAHPRVLDADTQAVIKSVERLYFSLLMAAPYIGHENDPLLSGARHDGGIDVRRVIQYDAVLAPPGCRGAVLDDAMLVLTRELYNGLLQIEGGGEHSRLWRMVRAFYTALQDNQFGSRIHQLVRCIEGFVFPDEGQTRRQMTSRTELFLGPRHHELVQTLFDIRSAVEHLHGPNRVVNNADPNLATLRLAELSYEAEAIARYCLRRLLTTPALWPSFTDDAALAAFWSMQAAERRLLWGTPMEVATEFSRFDEANARIRLFQ